MSKEEESQLEQTKQEDKYANISNDPFWSAYHHAPKYVQDFLSSPQVSSIIYDAENKFGLEKNILGGLVGDYVLRLKKEDAFFTELQTELFLEPTKAKEVKKYIMSKLFALDILMKRYIRAAEGVDVRSIVEKEQDVEIDLAPVDYEKTMVKVLPQVVNYIKEEDKKRMENIISSYYGQVRTKAQTKEKLMHAKKIGGLELDEQTAMLVVNILENTDAIRQEKEKEFFSDEEEIKSKRIEYMKIAQKDVKKYFNMFSLYIAQKDTNSVIAMFQAMTASGVLFHVLKEHPVYVDMISPVLMPGSEIVTPKYIQLFLQKLFVEDLEVDEQEAAKYISQLANILRKLGQEEYSELAYFDMESQRFKYTRYQ